MPHRNNNDTSESEDEEDPLTLSYFEMRSKPSGFAFWKLLLVASTLLFVAFLFTGRTTAMLVATVAVSALSFLAWVLNDFGSFDFGFGFSVPLSRRPRNAKTQARFRLNF